MSLVKRLPRAFRFPFSALKSTMESGARQLSSGDGTSSDALILKILRQTKVIAMVGASPNSSRPSYHVMEYLQSNGYRVLPVNPIAAEKKELILNEVAYSSLGDIPESLRNEIDMVDVFRKPEDVSEIVDDAIRIGAKTVWMQLGVVEEGSAARARAAGLGVVMDRCPKIEHQRLKEAGSL